MVIHSINRQAGNVIFGLYGNKSIGIESIAYSSFTFLSNSVYALYTDEANSQIPHQNYGVSNVHQHSILPICDNLIPILNYKVVFH